MVARPPVRLSVAEMTPEDIPAVHAIESASFPTPWPPYAFREEIEANRMARYLVVRAGARVIAYAAVRLLVDETGQLLESFHVFFQEFWADRLELSAAQEEVSRVFLFRSFYKYNQLLQGDFRRVQIRPKGHYLRAFDVVVAHTGADLPRQLPDALLHEAAHQLIERRIYSDTAPTEVTSETGVAEKWMDRQDVASPLPALTLPRMSQGPIPTLPIQR